MVGRKTWRRTRIDKQNVLSCYLLYCFRFIQMWMHWFWMNFWVLYLHTLLFCVLYMSIRWPFMSFRAGMFYKFRELLWKCTWCAVDRMKIWLYCGRTHRHVGKYPIERQKFRKVHIHLYEWHLKAFYLYLMSKLPFYHLQMNDKCIYLYIYLCVFVGNTLRMLRFDSKGFCILFREVKVEYFRQNNRFWVYAKCQHSFLSTPIVYVLICGGIFAK